MVKIWTRSPGASEEGTANYIPGESGEVHSRIKSRPFKNKVQEREMEREGTLRKASHSLFD